MLLDLGPKQVLVIVSIHVSSRTPTGYLLPDDIEQAHITMTRQTDNEHLASLLFTIGIAFYCEMRHQISTMGMLYISTMNDAWLRLAAQVFL
jgi:hypothetical protein